jgi:hypothetical protein
LHERARNAHALTLPAGKRIGAACCLFRQANRSQLLQAES